ncbi:hypothetical protein ColTof4_00757 [Colletotrichum tofieldiae]|nr:hypothetical protein ColTof3_07970 [Colletotrichum tofieldiae]GKT68334.1 hypothetical protein ColTof4_00757 [Colletotrichum tofieldiae]GKT90654.1 hypothetical protein Ct61P_08504 [Colletotrichum tofieldiae]
MNGIVLKFNKLPRPQTIHSGLPNHWVFGLRWVSDEWAHDLMCAIHPQSKTMVFKASEILRLSTDTEQAKKAATALLKLFIQNSITNQGSGSLIAPWSWATDDPELAATIGDELRRLGVKHELCHVGICSAKDTEILDEGSEPHLRMFREVTDNDVPHWFVAPPGDESRCHGCGLAKESFPQPLRIYPTYSEEWYHSSACQWQHRKKHTSTCLTNRLESSDNLSSSRGTQGNPDTENCCSTNASTIPEGSAANAGS